MPAVLIISMALKCDPTRKNKSIMNHESRKKSIKLPEVTFNKYIPESAFRKCFDFFWNFKYMCTNLIKFFCSLKLRIIFWEILLQSLNRNI